MDLANTFYDNSSPVEIVLQAASHALDLAIQTAELHSSTVNRPIEEMVLIDTNQVE